MVSIRRSNFLQPGELIFGTRKVPAGVAYRMRTFFAVAALRLFVLAGTCFFADGLFDSTKAFDTMAAIAPERAWGTVMILLALACMSAIFMRSGRVGRAALVCTGTLMSVAGASFLSIAWQYGVGWWGVVAYFGLAAGDFVTASYSGEKVK
jgi:hypothetical protein